MNIQAFGSAISSFPFGARKSNQSNQVRLNDWQPHAQGNLAKSQRYRHGDVQKLVENRLTDSISKATDAPFISDPRHTGKTLDSDKLAERILTHIAKSYGQQIRQDPGFDTAHFLSHVRLGLEEGFAQARDALAQLGLLSDDQNASLDDAYASIQEGLNRLESSNLNPVNVTEVRTQGIAAQIRKSAEIEIVTKEGDVVKISLAGSAAMSQSMAHVKQNGSEATAFESSFQGGADFNISIEGDLNEDEQHALKLLLKQMTKVGKDFFSDNMQAAFKQAQKIGLDTEQLASLSMNLSMEKSVQAISTYQQTAMPEQNLPADKIKQIGGFLNRAGADLLSSQAALAFFADQQAAFNSLFEVVSHFLSDDYAVQAPEDKLPTLRDLIASNLNV
ncbi:MAG: hypothetical protein CTY19_05000 [Methylomonas sp.]|nr:MAG: hypothetical protein CTY19_05000 [Methylomonas sp.]